MNKRIKLYALAAVSFLVSSCDDFLTRYPDTAIPESEAMLTLDDASDVVLGIYSSFKNSGLYSGALTIAPDLQADYVYAVNGFTNSYGDVWRWNIRANDSYVNSVYAGLYQVASRCNFFLDYKEGVYNGLKTQSDRNIFNTRLGDVHFARALVYSDLIRTFCEAYEPAKAEQQLGICLVDNYIHSDRSIPRSSLKESYEFVLRDLAAADSLIKREGSDAVYFTKGAVWALTARVYLYMQEYEKAKEYATKVTELDYLRLADATTQAYVDHHTGERISEYDRMWRFDKADEVIWKVAMITTDRGGSLGRLFLGFNSYAYYPDYIPGNDFLASYSDYDGRYNSFFATTQTGYGFSATILNKYPGNSDLDGTAGRFFTNMPKVLRLSEVYLILAEASAMSGDENGANKALTALGNKRIKSYGTAGFSGESLIKEIRQERARELVMEGFRLSDLRRWKEGFARKKQPNTIAGANANELKVEAGRVEMIWPIPQHELDAAGGIVQPNPSNKQ